MGEEVAVYAEELRGVEFADESGQRFVHETFFTGARDEESEFVFGEKISDVGDRHRLERRSALRDDALAAFRFREGGGERCEVAGKMAAEFLVFFQRGFERGGFHGLEQISDAVGGE